MEAVAYNDQKIVNYSRPKTYCKLLLESCILKRVLILLSPYVLVTSIQNPVQCEICVIHQQHSDAKP